MTTNDPQKLVPPRGDIQSSAENHCTIITMAESRRVPGLIWVGTDDGNVQVTKDVPILSAAAVAAARLWEFEPAFVTGRSVDATVRFELKCQGE